MPETVDLLFAMAGDVHRNARALRQLGALSAAGLKITVLALEPGRVRSDLPAGIELVHVPVPGSGGPAFFAAVHRRFAAEAARRPARLYHASDLYVLRAMRSAARRAGARFSYDSRELYTRVAAVEGRPLVRRFWAWFEKGPIRGAHHVWTVSDAIADHLVALYGIARPSVQWNAPVMTPAPTDDLLRRSTGIADDTFLFVHLGQMRVGRGGEALIRASTRLRNGAVVFLGYGPERAALERLAVSLSAPVHFVDPVPPERIRSVLGAADVGITMLEDTCLNHRFALPNKLFDYLAAGVPVLASRLPEIDRILTLHDAGLSVDPRDEGALAAAMQQMADSPQDLVRWRDGALTAAETFDWASASQTFTMQMLDLINTPTADA